MRKLELVNTDIKLQDFRRDYNHSYFIHEFNGRLTIAYIADMNENVIILTHIPYPGTNALYSRKMFDKREVNLYFLEPKTGYHNAEIFSFYLSRSFRRQYHCGYNHNTYEAELDYSNYWFAYVQRVCNRYQAYDGNMSIAYLPELLNSYLNPVYYSIEEAWDYIWSGYRFQAALNPRFCLAVDPHSHAHLSLFYDKMCIGKCNKNKQLEIDPLVADDIMDVAKDYGLFK